MKRLKKLSRPLAIGMLALIGSFGSVATAEESSFACNRTVKAQVVALDQPWMWNRLGAAQPGGMIYALYGDVVKLNGSELPDPWKLSPDQRLDLARSLVGNVRLRDEKRARPLVLRANKGDCLEITFWNLLNPQPKAGTAFNPKLRAQGPASRRQISASESDYCFVGNALGRDSCQWDRIGRQHWQRRVVGWRKSERLGEAGRGSEL